MDCHPPQISKHTNHWVHRKSLQTLTFSFAGRLLVEARRDHQKIDNVAQVPEEPPAKSGQQHGNLYREKNGGEPREGLWQHVFENREKQDASLAERVETVECHIYA